MIYLLVTLAILSVWRLTYDFVATDGPFGIYAKIREFVKSKEQTWPRWIVDGIECKFCVSFWVGFLVATLLPWHGWQSYLLFALGCSGAVTLLARYLKAMYGSDLFEE